jgi:hypothetical protein
VSDQILVENKRAQHTSRETKDWPNSNSKLGNVLDFECKLIRKVHEVRHAATLNEQKCVEFHRLLCLQALFDDLKLDLEEFLDGSRSSWIFLGLLVLLYIHELLLFHLLGLLSVDVSLNCVAHKKGSDSYKGGERSREIVPNEWCIILSADRSDD